MTAPTARRRFFSTAGGTLLARDDLAARLRRETRGEVLFDAFSRGRYATDASARELEPVGVLLPRTEADVAAAIELAREAGVAVLPRGAGTSLGGQALGQALVIDDSRHLTGVADFDPRRMAITVQPGLALASLNAMLESHGLWLPVDPSTAAQCTIGGLAGNDAWGAHAIAHGTMADQVLGIDAILSDGTHQYFGAFGDGGDMRLDSGRVSALVSGLFGLAVRERDEIARRWPRAPHRAGGYRLDLFLSQAPQATLAALPNLGRLLVGAEGSLAVYRRLRLRLARRPAVTTLGLAAFGSLREALAALPAVAALRPAALELLDGATVGAAVQDVMRSDPALPGLSSLSSLWAVPGIGARAASHAWPDVATPPAWPDAATPPASRGPAGPRAFLLVEFAGEEAAGPQAALRALSELLADRGQAAGPWTVTEQPLQRALRRACQAATARTVPAVPGASMVSPEACALPFEALEAFADGAAALLARHGAHARWHGAAAAGGLLLRPVLESRVAGDRIDAAVQELAELVRRCGGTVPGGWRRGAERDAWTASQFGEPLARAFAEVKDLFDPPGLLNPGRVVRAERAAGEPRPRRPAIDAGVSPFAAAAQCNGNGRCRGFDAGTMCPSFRVTRDERHSTRGRANSLRLALEGRLGPDALVSDAMAETLALCVQCKACRRECPDAVDVSRMKTEFLHRRQQRHGLPLRDRLIAYLPRWAPWAARLAPLANLRDRVPLLARASERWLGLDASRSLPRWRRDGFFRTLAPGRGGPRDPGRRGDADLPGDAPEVVLLVDTFNDHFEPDNARAALRVLEAAGYRVHVAGADGGRPLCCGRTFLSAGLIEQARSEAQRTLDALLPFAARGVPIVGLEPACLLTLRDEFLTLGLQAGSPRSPGSPARASEVLARAAMLFEEFLAREQAAGRLKLALKALPARRALLHGHCHQKAFDAVAPARTVLALVPGLQVEVLEAGCCGMAGGFGYAAEHAGVSRAMAEAALLPAVRAAGEDTIVVADGASCRHQIADGAQRGALHVARVLEAALA